MFKICPCDAKREDFYRIMGWIEALDKGVIDFRERPAFPPCSRFLIFERRTLHSAPHDWIAPDEEFSMTPSRLRRVPARAFRLIEMLIIVMRPDH
jgi:hypothetical protein